MAPKLPVFLSNPERFWLAARSDIPYLSDPDVDDGYQRWADRDELRWGEIARVVEEAGQRVVAGGVYIDEEQDQLLDLWIPDWFTPAERKVVTSWFKPSSSPHRDPWADASMGDGRHRLWNTWKRAPDALLPIFCYSLSYLDDLGEARLQASIQQGLDSTASEILNRSPLLAAELRRIASLLK